MESVIQNLSVCENGLIIKELFEIFNTVSCGKSYREMAVNVCKGFGKSILVMLIAYLIKQQNHHFSVVANFLAIKFLYRTIKLPNLVSLKYQDFCETYNADHQFHVKYYNVRDEHYYQFIPYIHSHFINEVLCSIEKERKINDARFSYIHNLRMTQTVPDRLFPSSSFLMLETIIRRHLEFVTISSQFNNLPIVINGKPGLGKTSSLSYLAEKKVCENFFHIDMTLYFDMDFSGVISKLHKLLEKLTTHQIVLVDELDKWLEQSMQNFYILEKEEKKDLKKDEFFKAYKSKFLYELLQLIEKRNGKTITIFIFCCNNFNSIFENINMRHFKSLQDRFLSVHFEMCDKNELSKYIRFMNQQFVGNLTFYVPDNKLEDIVSKIDDDIKLPFRKLTQMFIMSGYEFSKFVDIANQYSVESSSVCSSDLSENMGDDTDGEKTIVDNEEDENKGEENKEEDENKERKNNVCVKGESESDEVEITLDELKKIIKYDSVEDENEMEFSWEHLMKVCTIASDSKYTRYIKMLKTSYGEEILRGRIYDVFTACALTKLKFNYLMRFLLLYKEFVADSNIERNIKGKNRIYSGKISLPSYIIALFNSASKQRQFVSLFKDNEDVLRNFEYYKPKFLGNDQETRQSKPDNKDYMH